MNGTALKDSMRLFSGATKPLAVSGVIEFSAGDRCVAGASAGHPLWAADRCMAMGRIYSVGRREVLRALCDRLIMIVVIALRYSLLMSCHR